MLISCLFQILFCNTLYISINMRGNMQLSKNPQHIKRTNISHWCVLIAHRSERVFKHIHLLWASYTHTYIDMLMCGGIIRGSHLCAPGSIPSRAGSEHELVDLYLTPEGFSLGTPVSLTLENHPYLSVYHTLKFVNYYICKRL